MLISSKILEAVKLTLRATVQCININNVVSYLLIDINDGSYLTFSAAVLKVHANSWANNKNAV